MRFFITPKITALQTGTQSQGFCWRQCGASTANHFHIFWACPKIQPYWREVATEIHKIMGVELDYSFITLYLGKIPETVLHRDKYLLKILLASSRKAITRRWLRVDPPTLDQWRGIVKEIYCMERFTFVLRLELEKCTEHCGKNGLCMHST